MACLLDKGADLSLANESNSPGSGATKIEPAGYPRLCPGTELAVHIEDIVQVFVRIGDLRVRVWFGVVEHLAAGSVLLGPSSFVRCLWGIFPRKRKVVPWHSHPVSILSSSPAGISLFADVSKSNVRSAHAAKSGGVNNVEEEKIFTSVFISSNCDTSM